MFDNQRPGIYSRVEISGGQTGGGAHAALLLPSREDESPGVFGLESPQDAPALLAGNDLALRCSALLFEGGAGQVSVITSESAAQALEALDALGGVRAVVSGFTHPGELTALRDFAEQSSAGQRECIAFAGIGSPQAAINAADSLRSGRVVLCCPALRLEEGEAHPLYGACALAAAVLGARTPTHNFSGQVFPSLREDAPLPEQTVQSLLRAGVSVFERSGEQVELIRALSTDPPRESGGGSLRCLSTLLIIDDVVMGIRAVLREKLRGAGRATIEGIRDQVAVALAAKKDMGTISSFAPPRCRADKNDPGICVVEISFGVAHLLNKIHLTAHIRVSS